MTEALQGLEASLPAVKKNAQLGVVAYGASLVHSLQHTTAGEQVVWQRTREFRASARVKLLSQAVPAKSDTVSSLRKSGNNLCESSS